MNKLTLLYALQLALGKAPVTEHTESFFKLKASVKGYADQIYKYFLSQKEVVLIRKSNPHGMDLELLKSGSGLIFIGGDGTIRPYLPYL